MRVTEYTLTTHHPHIDLRLAIVADLHDHRYDHIVNILQKEKPHAILIPGDLTETLEDYTPDMRREGLGFLKEAVSIAPTFYAYGNHDIGAYHRNVRRTPQSERRQRGHVHPRWREVIEKSRAVLLDDDFVSWNGIIIGGVGSGLWHEGRVPNREFVSEFDKQAGYKILLCHHPEYFNRYFRDTNIDLFVSGHAHGGQWRLFGKGVYAPDQYLFPKYTSGVHEGRLVISRGVVNSVSPIPRIFNPCEIVMMNIQSK